MRFWQRSEAGLQRKLLSPEGYRCVFETMKTCVFSQDSPFDTKPLKADFPMILASILEAFWEPGLLTFCFLVAPVANACMFFGKSVSELDLLCEK